MATSHLVTCESQRGLKVIASEFVREMAVILSLTSSHAQECSVDGCLRCSGSWAAAGLLGCSFAIRDVIKLIASYAVHLTPKVS